MTEEILQCCYTNAERNINGIVSSGWQAVAFSEKIPPDAYETCVRLQNANSVIQGNRVDEDGNILNLMEITGDGKYLYVMQTKYGLFDRLGRQNMFSHAFILPCQTPELVTDPNRFLTIAAENFKTSEAEALEKTTITRSAEMNLATALQRCGLTKASYQKLMYIIYAEISERRNHKPLFLQYDGTREHMQALLYCIYYALPFSYRRTLTVASAPTDNAAQKNIVFAKHPKQALSSVLDGYYAIPETGENNVLNERSERKIARLGFVDFAIKTLHPSQIPVYYRQLEIRAVELGDVTASDSLILKIAHQLIAEKNIQELADTELDNRLSDALRSRSVGNDRMDEYICTLLEEFINRGLELSEENNTSLVERVNQSSDVKLQETVRRYNMDCFRRLSENSLDVAVKRLVEMRPTLFAEYREDLCGDPKGLHILDHYYTKVTRDDNEKSWESLGKTLSDIEDLNRQYMMQTYDCIEEAALALYTEELRAEMRCAHPSFEGIREHYMQVMRRIVEPSKEKECWYAANDLFWELVDMETFSLADHIRYKAFQPKDNSLGQKYLLFIQLGTLSDKMSHMTYDVSASMESLSEFFIDNMQAMSASERKTAQKKLLLEIAKGDMATKTYFSQWCEWFMEVKTKPEMQALLNVYMDIEATELDDIPEHIKELISLMREDPERKGQVRIFAEFLLKCCIKKDTERQPVSLDVWLSISRYAMENSFDFLDWNQMPEDHPRILAWDAYNVVERSRLIRQQAYQEQAEAYRKDKGDQAKAVKKWLDEAKKLEKQKKDTKQKDIRQKDTNQKDTNPKDARQKDARQKDARQKDTKQQEKGGFRGFFGRK